MSMSRSAQAQAWLPEDFGRKLDIVVQSKAIAAKTSTGFSTTREKVLFPLWVQDPAVAWYPELGNISLTDGATDQVVVVPTKTGGITLASNEMLYDTDPAIAGQIALALANQIAQSVDSAYCGNTVSNGPSGLQSLSPTVIASSGSLQNLDQFIQARYAAELHAAHLTHFLVHPTTAQALSQLKIGSAFNQSLLSFVDDGVQIAGIPVITSIFVDSGTLAWGIDSSQQRYVLRSGTAIETFPAITNDGTYVRALSRIGFGFLNPAGVIRIAQNANFTLTVNGVPTAGTYTVKVNGVETATIAFNANAAAIKATIVAVDDGITASNVTVTGSGPFTVSLPATLSHGTDALTGGTTPSTTVAAA
jgi:HK97 family phage major capsid protein